MGKLYKVVSVTKKNGDPDLDRIARIKEICENMTGKILYPEFTKPGSCLCLLWDNGSGKMMRTSMVESIESKVGLIKVTTRNTIYELEELKT